MKYIYKGTIVLHSLIAHSIKGGDCSDACNFIARHCANASSQIHGIDFDPDYSPVTHADQLRVKISIVSINMLTAMILDVSNASKNKSFTINEIVCVSPPPYCLDWFEISYPNVPLNPYEGPFFLQCMTAIQGTKSAGQQRNRLHEEVVPVLKYNKSAIDHAIYIKIFYDGKVSYITVSTYDVLNNTNNETAFPELRTLLKKLLRLNFKKDLYLSTKIYEFPVSCWFQC